jgi:hypothetical protein
MKTNEELIREFLTNSPEKVSKLPSRKYRSTQKAFASKTSPSRIRRHYREILRDHRDEDMTPNEPRTEPTKAEDLWISQISK